MKTRKNVFVTCKNGYVGSDKEIQGNDQGLEPMYPSTVVENTVNINEDGDFEPMLPLEVYQAKKAKEVADRLNKLNHANDKVVEHFLDRYPDFD